MFKMILYHGILLLLMSCVSSERLGNQIYSSVEGASACFRRLNGTHQAGCSTPDSGSVGVVQMIHDITDAEWMTLNGTAGPYMAVVSTELFQDTIEIFMSHPQNVAGVLLYENTTSRDYSYTPESRCPNEYSSATGSQCSSSQQGGIVWNEKGTGLLRRDIPFPIFFVPFSQIAEIEQKVEKCYARYNLDRSNQMGRPLCALQMHSFQFAAINAEVCMRRSAMSTLISSAKVCDPLGDHNVIYSLYPRTKDLNDTVTLVTARIDTASLFDGVAPGAAGSVVGMVTLLTAATLLSKLLPIENATDMKSNVIFTLLNGESFDYIGSQRVAYDMSRGAWPAPAPLPPARVRLHLDIGQIGGSLRHQNESWPIAGYAPYTGGYVPSEVREFLAEMTTNLGKNQMTLTPEFTANLPPSSIHSFRRILSNVTESGELPELLLVDHIGSFTNHLYHSVLDDDKNIGYLYRNISIDANGTFVDTQTLLKNGTMQPSDPQVKIARLATALAHTLYQRVTGSPYTGDQEASAHMVDEMLYCFVKNQSCRLLLAADYFNNPETPPAKPAPLYVSVAAWIGSGAAYAGHSLALLTGKQLTANKTACGDMDKPGYSYHYLRGWNNTGVCIETTLNFTQAISPAFTIPNYEYKSGEFSTWTESVWQSMWARVFVKASGAGARAALAAGVLATLLTAAATYWLRKHAQLLFAAEQPAVRHAASGILRTVNC